MECFSAASKRCLRHLNELRDVHTPTTQNRRNHVVLIVFSKHTVQIRRCTRDSAFLLCVTNKFSLLVRNKIMTRNVIDFQTNEYGIYA